MSEPTDETGEVDPRDLARELRTMLDQNNEAQARLAHHGVAVPAVRLLLLRVDLLLEALFGPIDYTALTDPRVTSPDRLRYEHAYQAGRRRLLAMATAEVDQYHQGQGPDGLSLPPQPGRLWTPEANGGGS